MATFREKEITDEELQDKAYCLELFEAINNAFTNEDYSEISHEIILDAIPNNIRLRDAFLFFANKNHNVGKNLLSFVSDVPKDMWPTDKVKMARLTQLLAALSMVAQDQETCEKLLSKVAELDPKFDHTPLAALLYRACNLIQEEGVPAKLFVDSLNHVTLEEILN